MTVCRSANWILGLVCLLVSANLARAQTGVPDSPVGVSASVADNTVTLTWQPPTTGGAPTGYVVRASLTSDGPAIASITVSGTTLVAPDVPPGLYYVTVVAVNAAGPGVPSPTVEVKVLHIGGCPAPPNPPEGVTSRVSGNLVSLTWAPPRTGCAADGFVLQAGTAPRASNIAQVSLGGQTALSAEAPPGIYYIRVIAVNGSGASAPSPDVEVAVALPTLRVPLNPSAPLWFGLEREGTSLDVYGGRKDDGALTVPLEAQIRSATDDESATVGFAATGMPNRISSSAGLEAEVVRTGPSALEMRFVLESGEQITVPVPLPPAPVAAARAIAPAASNERASLAGRTIHINLVHEPACVLPPDVRVFLQVEGGRFLPATRIAGNTYGVDIPGPQTTTLGQLCGLIRSAGRGGVPLDQLLRSIGVALTAHCPRFLAPQPVAACFALAAAIVAGAAIAPYVEVLCHEQVAQGWDWFAELFRSDFATVQPRAVIEGRNNFGGNVLVPRDGPIDPISLEVECDLSRTPLSAPRTLLGYESDGHIRLSWSPPATGVPTQYLIDAGTTPGASDLANGFAISALTNPLVFFSPRVPHGRYHIRMRARNATMTSPSSREIAVDVPEARRYIWGTGRFVGSLVFTRPSGVVCTYSYDAILTSRLDRMPGDIFAFWPGMRRDETGLQSIPLILPPDCFDNDAAGYPGAIVLRQVVLKDTGGVLSGVREDTFPWWGTERQEVTITPDGDSMTYTLTYRWSGGEYNFVGSATATGVLIP